MCRNNEAMKTRSDGTAMANGRPTTRKRRRGSARDIVEEKHFFFLNPYEDMAFTKCPKCESKTKVRKHALVIHIEPSQLLFLNKLCRYCVACDLIIARRSEVESLMMVAFESRDPSIIGNEYFVVGTLPRDVWRSRNDNGGRAVDALDRTHLFKNVYDPV